VIIINRLRSARALGLAVLLMAIAGCESPTEPTPGPGPGPGPDPTPQGIEGTWRATRAEFVDRGNSSRRVDVAAAGTNVTLLLAGTTFTLTVPDPRVPANVTTGTWTSSIDVMRLTPAGMPWSMEFDFVFSGNTLILNGGSAEFDFDGNGTFEQATLNLMLTRP
jgi:hypothetical protein